MACPHVAGVAALIRAAAPGTTPAQMRRLLRSTAQDLGPAGPDATYGFGLVDAFAAIQQATGAQLPTPLLSVSPGTISFGSTDVERSVSLTNVGSGEIIVASTTTTYAQGDGWLEAELLVSPSGSNISHDELLLTADRTGLATGDYAATVTITSTGLPDTSVQVLLGVGSDELPDHTVYVILVDFETLETVEQAITSLAGNYAWSMADLPEGSYLLVAGTDENDDGFIGDEGEPLFGMWPSTLDPQLLELAEDAELSGVDFPVAQSEIGALGWSPPSGFRLR
jgi:serine protease